MRENKSKSDESSGEMKGRYLCGCPRKGCGGKIMRNGRGWFCTEAKNGCRNGISDPIMGNRLSEDEVMSVFTGIRTGWKKGVTRSGGTLLFRIGIDDDGGLMFEYAGEEICPCPVCGGKVSEAPRFYRCNSEGCRFILWKETRGMSMTPGDLRRLCGGRSVRKERVKKDGESVVCSVRLSSDRLSLEISY